MEEILSAIIVKDFDDSVAICLRVGSYSNEKAFNSVIKKNLILFRGKPAPSNLLKNGTIIKVKLLNKVAQSAEVDQNIERIAIFGYIGDVNDNDKTILIKTYKYDQEITYQDLLGPDNEILEQGTHQSYISQPVIMYFNNEVIIEARILTETFSNSHKLAEFHRNQSDQKADGFFVLKDDSFIPHRIHESRVFYKNGAENFAESEVEDSIGTEVKVIIENKEIKAFIQKEKFKDPDKNNQLTNSLTSDRNPLHQDLSPRFGKRKTLISGYFVLRDYSYGNRIIMLLGLLEVCYRLPDWQMRSFILQEILESMILPKDDLDKLNLLLNTVVNTELGNIEKFYKLFDENILVLKNVSKCLFDNYLNFNKICNKYKIYIFETNRSMQQCKTYKPLCVSEPIPYISLCNESKLRIIYDLNMMLYDGYSPSGDEYIVQQYLNQDTLKIERDTNPNYRDLINATKKLQDKLPRSDKDLINIYFEIVNSLNTVIPPEVAPEYENLYEDLLNFNLDPNFIELECKCGAKANKDYQCNDHYLCDGCAFISLRLQQCVICSASFNNGINVKENNCSACKASFESKYIFGFRCKCILCCSCLNHLLSQGCKACYNSHKLKESSIDLAIEFLRELGYNPNS